MCEWLVLDSCASYESKQKYLCCNTPQGVEEAFVGYAWSLHQHKYSIYSSLSDYSAYEQFSGMGT